MKNYSIFLLVFFSLIASLSFVRKVEKPLISCKQIIKGEVRDSETKNLIQGAKVELIEMDENTSRSIVIDNEVNFSFVVLCNKGYILRVSKNGYKTESKVLKTSRKKNKEIKLMIVLEKNMHENIQIE